MEALTRCIGNRVIEPRQRIEYSVVFIERNNAEFLFSFFGEMGMIMCCNIVLHLSI